MKLIIILIFISIISPGCSWVADFPKTAWGSSIRVLSEKRSEAESAVFGCSRDTCFDHVLDMTIVFGAGKEKEDQKYVLFAKAPDRSFIVVMGVPGGVDTTEVGVFFDTMPDGQTQIQVSSLSSRAKMSVADAVFEKLSQMCE